MIYNRYPFNDDNVSQSKLIEKICEGDIDFEKVYMSM